MAVVEAMDYISLLDSASFAAVVTINDFGVRKSLMVSLTLFTGEVESGHFDAGPSQVLFS